MLEKRLREIGQDHIAKLLENHVNFLSPQMVSEDIEQVDFPLVTKLIEGKLIYKEPLKKLVDPADVIPSTYAATQEAEKYYSHGENMLRQGKVAALIVAGGQGSRLGIEAPKGVVEVTPLKSKSLFCLFSQKILALSRKYGSNIPFYIMTSRTNCDQTKAFFEKNNYFGLMRNEVYFFVQGMLPSVTPDGKFIISQSGSLFMNPDGHGGTFSALRKSGCLDIMKEKGIEEIFYFQVDNPLVKVCDPLFIGLHNLGGAQMSSKVVRKRSFEEKVGVIACADGKTRVIEYSDMNDEMRYYTNEMGEMLHWAGSIAIHVIRRDFVENLTRSGLRLPYHRAVKIIPTLDEKGNPIEAKGIKFETFIFDALPLADKSITLEVSREEEFAPIKNKTGEDSLESSMILQSTHHKKWLENIGVQVKDEVKVEISPLYALDEKDLRKNKSKIPNIIKSDIYLRGPGEEE